MGSCGLLVLNKKTQLLNFVPVTANKTFRLLPLARASQISDKEPSTPIIIETAEEKRQKEYELTVLYGTKDAKKKKNKAMKLRMNQDTGDAEEVDQIIEEEKMDNAALASSSSDTTRDVPPHNLSATTPEEAYLLDKIILKGEWDYVNDVLELLQAGQELKPDIYPSFVRNRFHKLELSQDEAKKRKLAGILSYITHLVNFKNWNSLDGSSSSKHRKPPPRILSQKFTKMFIDSDKNRLADDKIGSLVGYVLVLTLFVDEFETDFTDISKDLKMSTLTIRPYLENLGCRFKRQKNVTLATLPVPLTFPTIRKKRRRGNK
ncbi:unnamed protein product [Amaranthus hypochondriacus]